MVKLRSGMVSAWVHSNRRMTFNLSYLSCLFSCIQAINKLQSEFWHSSVHFATKEDWRRKERESLWVMGSQSYFYIIEHIQISRRIKILPWLWRAQNFRMNWRYRFRSESISIRIFKNYLAPYHNHKLTFYCNILSVCIVSKLCLFASKILLFGCNQIASVALDSLVYIEGGVVWST